LFIFPVAAERPKLQSNNGETEVKLMIVEHNFFVYLFSSAAIVTNFFAHYRAGHQSYQKDNTLYLPANLLVSPV
jgi:hypothetical protein